MCVCVCVGGGGVGGKCGGRKEGHRMSSAMGTSVHTGVHFPALCENIIVKEFNSWKFGFKSIVLIPGSSDLNRSI